MFNFLNTIFDKVKSAFAKAPKEITYKLDTSRFLPKKQSTWLAMRKKGEES